MAREVSTSFSWRFPESSIESTLMDGNTDAQVSKCKGDQMRSFWNGFGWRLGSNLANSLTGSRRSRSSGNAAAGCGSIVLAGFLVLLCSGLLSGPSKHQVSKPVENRIQQRPTVAAAASRPAASTGANALTISGTVVGLADGDTLTILDSQQNQHKIRLHGIDTPESGQPFGHKAQQALAGKVFQKRVRAVITDTDRYGRYVAEIYVDDRLVNKELVEEGWAWHYRQYSDSEELAEAERAARDAKLGLWTDTSPIAPWDWRRGTRPSQSQETASERPQPVITQDDADTSAADQLAAAVYAKSLLDSIAAENQPDPIVYVTKTGAKYHSGYCRYLRKSKIPISLSSARGRYSACSVCGGVPSRSTVTAFLDGSSGQFDEELREWRFQGKIGTSAATVEVFLDRKGSWKTRRLQIGEKVVHQDTSTPGRGKEWDKILTGREQKSREDAAHKLLLKAQTAIDKKQSTISRTYLEQIVADYPDTPDAETAKQLLAEKFDTEEPPADGIDPETERRAQSKLTLAKKLLRRDRIGADRWLQEVVDEFPGTEAAKEAKKLLENR